MPHRLRAHGATHQMQLTCKCPFGVPRRSPHLGAPVGVDALETLLGDFDILIFPAEHEEREFHHNIPAVQESLVKCFQLKDSKYVMPGTNASCSLHCTSLTQNRSKV